MSGGRRGSEVKVAQKDGLGLQRLGEDSSDPRFIYGWPSNSTQLG